MPHCILEYSSNVLDSPDMRQLCLGINRALMASGLFTLADIKTRAIKHECFVIGDGSDDQAFVTLNIQVLSGRADEVKAEISDRVLQVLVEAFPRTMEKMRFNLSVQISELHKPSYRRKLNY
jgi:5-carboxymethyl-2-hydroxymuconate isomerase